MFAKLLRLSSLVLLLSGCAHNSTPLDPYDPYEDINRDVFVVNEKLDAYLLAPTSRIYSKVTPEFVRKGVDNFFSNALYPNVILNDFLQGKAKQGLKDTGRFLVNTTVGVAGLFDPAQHLGLEAHNEDLGQTLAVWGVDSGPYLELPAFGPHYARHVADMPVQSALNVLYYALEASTAAPLMVLYYINKRSLLESAVKIREEAALDPYLFTRSAYMQYRQQLIYDGNPPQDDLYDEFFEELEEEEVE